MSALGDFVTGMGVGAGQIAEGYIKNEQAYDLRSRLMVLEEARDRRAAQLREELRRDGGEYDAKQAVSRRRAQGAELESEAGAAAAKRGGLLSSSARDAYKNSGMSEADINAGLGAVDEAEKAGSYKQEPTTQDYEAAGLKTGLLGVGGKITNDRADKKDARDDKTEDRANRLTDAQIKNIEDDNKRADNAESRAGSKAAKSDADAKMLRKWQSRYFAMGANDSAFAATARANIIALGGKDPAGKSEGSYDFSVVDSADGKGVVIGNKKTGEAEFRTPGQMTKTGDEVRYDRSGLAYRKGPDGKPVRAPERDRK